MKFYMLNGKTPAVKSPPSRGAWIEIAFYSCMANRCLRRPPRGGRGLKYHSAR